MAVAVFDLGLVGAEEGEGLAQAEEVFRAVVADEGFGDGLRRGFDPVIAQGGEGGWVAFACEDGVEDGEAGDAGDVADDVVKLKVHLGERLLDMLHVSGGAADEHVAVSEVGAEGADDMGRSEGAAK